jgi:hypothetical protein
MKSLGIRDIKFFMCVLEWAKQDRLAFVDAYNEEEKVVVEAKEDIIKIEKLISKFKRHVKKNNCSIAISLEERLVECNSGTFQEIKKLHSEGFFNDGSEVE